MIDSLFHQPNYLAAKKLLEATSAERVAISGNLANAETPGYQRLHVAPSFKLQLQEAIRTGDMSALDEIAVRIQEDSSVTTSRQDGNNVSIEREMFELMRNSMDHAMETQLLTGNLLRLRLAITGRP
ncbi:MAG: flagellar basal body rod protein FlgB [Verrucomicrobia bacterium]|nr:flagellar basal body rod protein FlgB [Verrucomicrobiota bacterium]